jgi:dienelactone hydrolase
VRRGVIGLNGFSLGGRLALRVAARRTVLAVSAIAARTSSGSTPTVLEQADRLTVPILLQHGTDDSVVPYNDSVLLERKLKSLGRSVEFVSYPGAAHNTLPWDRVYEKVLSFFMSHLR